MDKLHEYIAWDPNAETRREASLLAECTDAGGDEQRSKALRAFTSGRLEFGTAGLRGPMGVGFNRMNEVTVLQAAQGLVAHLLATGGEAAKAAGIVIGYDHRSRGSLNSHRFALMTAVAAVSRGMRVHLFDRLVATPLVPFAIRKTGAVGGVMVTASHNPKEDNGYKVYAANGAQIIAPTDAAIAAAIVANLQPWAPAEYSAASEESVRSSEHCAPFDTAAMIETYLDEASAALCRHRAEAGDTMLPRLTVAYTAMHGVGTPFTTAMVARFGLPPLVLTPAQVQPDPTFPTVAFPNPEEGKGALALAMAAADAAGASLILANDPDADRLAVAEWVPAGSSVAWASRIAGGAGEWRVFTGNEIGTLLAAWMYRGWLATHPGGPASVPPSARPLFLSSTVSSKILGAMARRDGSLFAETLTGFKYMGSEMAVAEASGTGAPLFAFEEAIGFSVWPYVRDKDGVTAAAVFNEMANALAREGRTCSGALADLFATYGVHATCNVYVVVEEPSKTEAIFDRLRAGGRYWGKLGNLAITSIRDLTGTGWDSTAPGGVPTLPTSSANMLTYTFSNGVVATLRSSGTEPKLKVYAEGRGAAGGKGDAAEREAVRGEAVRTVRLILDEMLQPEVHGLKRPLL
jgi:phosphomannomutase